MPPRELLLIPGPTPVPDPVLAQVSRQPIGHRSQELSKVLHEAVADLKWLADTNNDVFVLTASGTGAMECAIANTINPGDHVLSLICGVFGERWAKIAEAFGAKVERVNVQPGHCIDPEVLAKRLASDTGKSIKAVTMTHNETSTGVINDLEKLAQLVSEHGALSIVDAVTSFGATAVPIDKWKVDLLISGSQKAMMLPPGLSFVFVSAKAWDASTKCKNPRFYFDFAKQKKSIDADTTPFTPNVSLILALNASLKLIKEEGKEACYARHKKLRDTLRAGVKAMGLKLLADESCASPSVTAILPPDNISVDAIRKELKDKFKITVADGQEDLKGKIFRISHMGYIYERDMLTVLAALKETIQALNK